MSTHETFTTNYLKILDKFGQDLSHHVTVIKYEAITPNLQNVVDRIFGPWTEL